MMRHRTIVYLATGVIARWVSTRLKTLGVWMTHEERTAYAHLKAQPAPTDDEAQQLAALRKTARKYRKLKRQTSKALNITGRPSLFGVALFLDMKDHIARKRRARR